VTQETDKDGRKESLKNIPTLSVSLLSSLHPGNKQPLLMKPYEHMKMLFVH
jgi:hypothetical protein